MTSFTDLPEQFNFLDPQNHQFVISRLPMTTFMVQEIEVPTVTLGAVHTGNPFISLNYAASSPEFGDLRMTFKVDEDMRNYREIFDWMMGLGFPEEFDQYRDLKANPTGKGGIRSDASLVLNTSSNISNKTIYFKDIFPIMLSGMRFSTTREGPVRYLEADVTFSIRSFTIEDTIP